MKAYTSLFKLYKEQPLGNVFAHFYPVTRNKIDPPDWDEPFCAIARQTVDGYDAWGFHQERFRLKTPSTAVPKLRNYLNYTFVRLCELERAVPGRFFSQSQDGDWVAFNTGLQNKFAADLFCIFQRYKARPGDGPAIKPDWVYKACHAGHDQFYRDRFAGHLPDIAWYSKDARDFIFDPEYALEKDAFDHLFDRAKERAGMPNASEEVVRTYLRGAIETLVPKIRRNYKVAIPVYYVEEKRMQLLLPFYAADYSPANPSGVSCFLVDRVEATKSYRLKTIFDLDQAYYSARLLTRPDRDWLDP
jgi:hypothetical protein